MSYTKTRRRREVERRRPRFRPEPAPRRSGIGAIAALVVVVGAVLWLLSLSTDALSDVAQSMGLTHLAWWLFENGDAVRGFMLIGYPAIGAIVIGVAYLMKRR